MHIPTGKATQNTLPYGQVYLLQSAEHRWAMPQVTEVQSIEHNRT